MLGPSNYVHVYWTSGIIVVLCERGMTDYHGWLHWLDSMATVSCLLRQLRSENSSVHVWSSDSFDSTGSDRWILIIQTTKLVWIGYGTWSTMIELLCLADVFRVLLLFQ